jgi:hypothetical protein
MTSARCMRFTSDVAQLTGTSAFSRLLNLTTFCQLHNCIVWEDGSEGWAGKVVDWNTVQGQRLNLFSTLFLQANAEKVQRGVLNWRLCCTGEVGRFIARSRRGSGCSCIAGRWLTQPTIRISFSVWDQIHCIFCRCIGTKNAFFGTNPSMFRRNIYPLSSGSNNVPANKTPFSYSLLLFCFLFNLFLNLEDAGYTFLYMSVDSYPTTRRYNPEDFVVTAVITSYPK